MHFTAYAKGAFFIFPLGRAYALLGVSALAYETTQKEAAKEQALSLQNRQKLSLTGVEDVSGFDENTIVLSTALGALTVRGEGLHIERIDLDAGQLEVRGTVQELSYDEPSAGGSVWKRLFG